jgi:copper(I)-binding protein
MTETARTIISVLAGTVVFVLAQRSMTMEGGVMKMRPVEGGLEIKPGETVTLAPSGFHVMLVTLKRPLEAGQTVKATLKFDKPGAVDVEYPVMAGRQLLERLSVAAV